MGHKDSQWGVLGCSQWDIGVLWGWEEGDGDPKRVWGPKGGCEDLKRGMGRDLGCRDPQWGVLGCSQWGTAVLWGWGEGYGDPKRGVGMGGCRETKGCYGDPTEGVGMQPKGWGGGGWEWGDGYGDPRGGMGRDGV